MEFWFWFWIGVSLSPLPWWLVARIRHVIERRSRDRKRLEVFIGGTNPVTGMHTPQRTKISRELREEIDQSPRWWDREFHKLLVKTRQHYLEYGEVEYIEERNLTGSSVLIQTRPLPRAYTDCTCNVCQVTRIMGGDPHE